ncbi:MAG: glycosyltransferase [Acidobacteria bacterium]|jgi:glycosyltransferase involved in cell wall biosynthesis|nr:glycosyltransferase [Acidobacteriota bacterium]
MNVLVLGNYFDRDGLTSKALSEAAYLAPLGVRLVIVVPQNPFARAGAVAKLQALGIAHYRALTHFRILYFFFPVTVWRLVRIMRREKIDLLHVNHGRTLLLGVILGWLRRVPLVYTIHGVSGRELPLAARGLLFRRVARVLPVSEESAAFFAGRVRYPARQVVIVRNAIDFAHFTPVEKKADGFFSMLYLSRLDHDKRRAVEAAMDAAARIFLLRPQARLRILGDGRQYGRIRKRARAVNGRLGQDVITVEGWADDPARFMDKCDLVLGVGRCVLEAVAAGRPALVLGNEGIGGRVTAENFPVLQATNFSGRGSAVATSGANLARILLAAPPFAPVDERTRALAMDGHDAARLAAVLQRVYLEVLAGGR